jgi:hypothetical protein
VHRIYVAEEQDCQCCPVYLRCLTAGGGKKRYLRVPIGVELTNFSKRMAGKVDSELGRKIYPQRFAVAEPVFTNLRTHKRLDRITYRRKVKVNIWWFLYYLGHYLEKITHHGSTEAKIWLKTTPRGKINLKKNVIDHPPAQSRE